MNKCQTSSPSELDPCGARVRRESGGEWRYEFVRTKIYYNNVEPTRRERGTVSLSVWPRGGWVILPSERAAARRPLARARSFLAYTLAAAAILPFVRVVCVWSSERKKKKEEASERETKRGEESYRGQLRQCAKELVIVDNAVRSPLPPADFP